MDFIKIIILILSTLLLISCYNRTIDSKYFEDISDLRPVRVEYTNYVNNLTKEIIFSKNHEQYLNKKDEILKLLQENKEGFEALEDSPDLYIKTFLGVRLNIVLALFEKDTFLSLKYLYDAEALIFNNYDYQSYIIDELITELAFIEDVRNWILSKTHL